jgi:hypothetical protein
MIVHGLIDSIASGKSLGISFPNMSAPTKRPTAISTPTRIRSSALIIIATLIVLRPGILVGEGRDVWDKVVGFVERWRREREESDKERRRRDRMTPL